MAEHPDPVQGAELRALRQWHRLSAERVAQAGCVSRRRIRQVETGKPTERAVRLYLAALAKAQR